jgi:hypothetical protein
MTEFAFRLGFPDGHWVTIFRDGRVDGVPKGTMVINRLPMIMYEIRQDQRSRDLAQRNSLPHKPQEEGRR